MEIYFSKHFQKRFQRLPKNVQKQFEKRINIFIFSPFDPILKNHSLKGNLTGYRAFAVTGNYRVIFRLLDQKNIRLVDIGTHNQVYEG